VTIAEYEAEIVRLHALILNLAERLAAASEVLGILAEKKDRRTAA
jgi:hypothetical protein